MVSAAKIGNQRVAPRANHGPRPPLLAATAPLAAAVAVAVALPLSDVERGYDTDDSRLDPGEVVRRKYRLMPYCCREFRDCMIATVIFWWAIGKLNENHPFLEWR